MLAEGSVVAGYRVGSLLGRGGMGRVFEAVDVALQRTVALKILSEELPPDEVFRARFEREGRVQGALEHPHVVRVYEAGEADGVLFIAMQLVRGPTLKELLAEGPLDPTRAVSLIAQVADALDSAHAAGLTHRDVKPQNVLIGPGDHAYLADFGVTKTLADTRGFTRTGHIVGTTDYISPEQVSGFEATPASDIYALGAMLYECLTGEPPFPLPTDAAVIFAHVNAMRPKVTALRPELPPRIDDVVAQAMATTPEDRPATAAALAEAAERALGRQRLLPIPSDRLPPTMAPASRLVPPESDPALTVPDRPPAELTAPPAAARRGRRRVVASGAALLAAAAAAVPGVWAGRAGQATRPLRPLSANAGNGIVALRLPRSWAPAAETAAGRALGLRSPVVRTGGGATVEAGVTGATTRSLLPPGFTQALGAPLPKPERVRLGELSAYRYTGLRLGGRPLTVFAALSTEGAIAVAETRPGPDADRVVASLRLTHGRGRPVGPDPVYARDVGRAVVELNQARATARRRLAAARTPAGQRGAASALASTYRRATRTVEALRPGPLERPVQAALSHALRATERAYAGLGDAAGRGQKKTYAARRRAVARGERATAHALDRLRALGYVVT